MSDVTESGGATCFPGLAYNPARSMASPLEDLALAGIYQLIENDLVNLGDGVGPVGMDAEAPHVADDQQRRIAQGTRILLKLGECRVQVPVGLLVLPGEMLFLPDIRPTGGSGCLDGPLL